MRNIAKMIGKIILGSVKEYFERLFYREQIFAQFLITHIKTVRINMKQCIEFTSLLQLLFHDFDKAFVGGGER